MQILLLMLWLVAILVRQACDWVHEGCFQMWLRVQRGREVDAQGERCWEETAGSRVRVASEGHSREASIEACWKQLVERPEEWWDNWTIRSNPRAPDFKHKRTRRAL